jgi:hypothetical protein
MTASRNQNNATKIEDYVIPRQNVAEINQALNEMGIPTQESYLVKPVHEYIVLLYEVLISLIIPHRSACIELERKRLQQEHVNIPGAYVSENPFFCTKKKQKKKPTHVDL